MKHSEHMNKLFSYIVLSEQLIICTMSEKLFISQKDMNHHVKLANTNWDLSPLDLKYNLAATHPTCWSSEQHWSELMTSLGLIKVLT